MDNEGRRYPIEAINRYLQRFDTESKESVLAEMQSRKILDGFLSTPHGRLMAGEVLDAIAADQRAIVRMSIEGFDANLEAIKHAALRIGIAYDFLCGLRTIYDRGNTHEEGIAKEEAAI
jgi:hypothetical protein